MTNLPEAEKPADNTRVVLSHKTWRPVETTAVGFALVVEIIWPLLFWWIASQGETFFEVDSFVYRVVTSLAAVLYAGMVLGTLYLFLALLLNKTVLSLSDDSLISRPWPFPMPGAKTIPRDTIEAIKVKGNVADSSNEEATSWKVIVETQEQKEIELLSGLKSRDAALEIRNALSQ
jgi:hypothetical protein